jgi:hypothetical protein
MYSDRFRLFICRNPDILHHRYQSLLERYMHHHFAHRLHQLINMVHHITTQ